MLAVERTSRSSVVITSVPLVQGIKGHSECWPQRLGSADPVVGVEVIPAHSGSQQVRDLSVEVLFRGRYPGVAD
jgi:hypothetical protein